MSNDTICQDPIENMVVTYTPDTTTQKSEWNPEIYLKTDEKLVIYIATDRGLPIDYIVKWGNDDSQPDNGTVEQEGTTFSFTWAMSQKQSYPPIT